MWASVVSDYKKQQDLLIAEQQLGYDFAQKILNMESADLVEFVRNQYNATNKLIDSKNQEINANKERLKSWEELKSEWSSVADNYELEQKRINVALQFGADFEASVLDQRLDKLKQFVKEYNAAYDNLRTAEAALAYEEQYASTYGYDLTALEAPAPTNSTSTTPDWAKEIEIDFIKQEMAQNSAKWLQATTQAERDALHEANLKLGASIGATFDPNTGIWTFPKYKKGTLSASGGISEVDENLKKELIVRNPTSRYTYLEYGDGVVPADLTKNLMNWGKFNPNSYLKNLIPNVNNENKSTSNTFHITMNGVNDVETFAQQLQQYVTVH